MVRASALSRTRVLDYFALVLNLNHKRRAMQVIFKSLLYIFSQEAYDLAHLNVWIRLNQIQYLVMGSYLT